MLEVSERWARNMVTALARIDGRPVGVIANQPWFLGGVIDATAAQKAARFVRTCNAFGLPLVVLVDTPGFLPGTKQEGLGVIRHGAKLLHAFAEAVVPKVTVVLRKAYGGAYICMNSKDLGADLALAWPGAEIGIMGPKQAVGVVHRRALAEADDPEAERDRLAAEYAEDHLSAAVAAQQGFIDEIVEPRDTRRRLAGAIAGLSHAGHVRQRPGQHPAMTTYVALGDSFTSGLESGEPRWADQVAQALGPGVRYENLAWVGATSADVERDQLSRALELRSGPGHADLRRQRRARVRPPRRRRIRRAARTHVRAAARDEAPGAVLLTATYPDISRFLDLRPRSRARVQKGMRRFNDAARAVARRHEVALLEYFDDPASDDRDTYAADGFHPSPEGHRRAAAAFLRALRQPLPADGGAGMTLFERDFDSLAVGDRFTTRGRTVGEDDIVAFATLTGDTHPQHVDELGRRQPLRRAHRSRAAGALVRVRADAVRPGADRGAAPRWGTPCSRRR